MPSPLYKPKGDERLPSACTCACGTPNTHCHLLGPDLPITLAHGFPSPDDDDDAAQRPSKASLPKTTSPYETPLPPIAITAFPSPDLVTLRS